MLTLAIFPEGGLASSVITTVWVGVLVLCFFNLRFGWVLSGLVVPGYLVPLIIVKPVSALVIVIEAILTYLIVYLFSEKLARGRFPALFGRDRFMGLILASIAVRLLLDGFLLPQAADWIQLNWNREVDWESDLQSFGLVIVSLMANQFWKPGLGRGITTMVVVTGISWFLVRYGLMEFTNFRISGVTYLYEGLASSVLASPKAYIILVLTALYASHMNVRYGWDFSGILIPALIALQWYEPTKILTSFAEAIAIYLIARQLLKTPWLANATMEGANKVLLFFNISFALKLLVGWGLLWAGWNVKTTDFYGFGYLLSTLLAMKAHDKDIFPRLMRSTLQVSFVGAGAGNLVGLALAVLIPANVAGAGTQTADDMRRTREDSLLVNAIGDAHWRAESNSGATLGSQSAEALSDAVELLEVGLPAVQAGAAAASGGWRVEALSAQRAAIIREDGQGRDLILFDANGTRDLVMRVDDPAARPGLVASARVLMEQLGARWLVVSAPAASGSTGQSVVGTISSTLDVPQLVVGASAQAGPPRLSLVGDSAEAIDLDALRSLYPSLAVSFADSRSRAGGATVGASSLSLSGDAIAALLAPRSATPAALNECQLPEQGAAAPQADSLEQLLFLRSEIVLPVLSALESGKEPTTAFRAAPMLGVILEPCTSGGQPHILLRSDDVSGGAYLFRRGGDPAVLIESALRSERRGTSGAASDADIQLVDMGLRVQQASNAQLLALAPRELRYDGSQATAFGIVTQAAIGRQGDDPALVVQLRPRPKFGASSVPADRAILLPDRLNTVSERIAAYEAMVRGAGYVPLVATRDARFAGYEAFPLASLRYLNQYFAKRYLIIYPPVEGR
ncbi:poly-gamma-glutamate biosynthesis protein PgsC/CapC [Qipengyuania marisflavi]|uniref:Capsule biosynthesis CapC n=1 Tax=Qipengyuania marisflavi TaxID=2486356 RepID=A0A5S3P7I6_9SPHN|nr:poly-gamma-glutamate biosynthesis protein PgsC/CapC [Qipengyuania marisflavi]TMM48193.1 hypothetical protein FEV51_07825 [Qipengyuania marisflavi]